MSCICVFDSFHNFAQLVEASLQRGTPPGNEYPGYDTNQFESEVPVLLELWGMRSTPSLPGPLLPGAVTSDRVLSMGQIELNCICMLNWIVWNGTVFDI